MPQHNSELVKHWNQLCLGGWNDQLIGQNDLNFLSIIPQIPFVIYKETAKSLKFEGQIEGGGGQIETDEKNASYFPNWTDIKPDISGMTAKGQWEAKLTHMTNSIFILLINSTASLS